MILQELIEIIEKKYPRFLAESWDNVGLMIGDRNQEIGTVITALEANEAVIDEAIDKKADLIITHHPFFFSKFNQITSDSVKGALTMKLIQNKIAVYSMHTNYDIAFDGMNDSFIRRIGHTPDGVFLHVSAQDWYLEANKGITPGLGRTFTLQEPVCLSALAASLKETLGMKQIRYIGDGNALIQKAAVITGAAADMYPDAQAAGADVLISGDMKYHTAQDALDSRMNVIDCGHFETENIFGDAMREFLTSVSDLNVISCCVDINPFQIV